MIFIRIKFKDHPLDYAVIINTEENKDETARVWTWHLFSSQITVFENFIKKIFWSDFVSFSHIVYWPDPWLVVVGDGVGGFGFGFRHQCIGWEGAGEGELVQPWLSEPGEG